MKWDGSSKKQVKGRETSDCDDVPMKVSSFEKLVESDFTETSSVCDNFPVEYIEEVNWPSNESVKEKIRLWTVKHGLTTTVVNE